MIAVQLKMFSKQFMLSLLASVICVIYYNFIFLVVVQQACVFINMVTVLCYVPGDEMVILHEDEFLAGFKPLNTAVRPLCKVSDVECKVECTHLIF